MVNKEAYRNMKMGIWAISLHVFPTVIQVDYQEESTGPFPNVQCAGARRGYKGKAMSNQHPQF